MPRVRAEDKVSFLGEPMRGTPPEPHVRLPLGFCMLLCCLLF